MLKICVIPPDQKVPQRGHISSGQERVAIDMAIALTEAGHTVDYWTCETNSKFKYDFNHKTMPGVFARTEQVNDRAARQKWAEDHCDKYDVFLFHADSGFILKCLVRLGYAKKVISFVHAPPFPGGWDLSYMSAQGWAKSRGATIVCVSERTKLIWDEWIQEKRLEIAKPYSYLHARPDLVRMENLPVPFIDRIFTPQVSYSHRIVKPALYKGLVLCRLSPEKNIEAALGHGLKFRLRRDKPEYEAELAERLKLEDCLLDEPHDSCMRTLERAGVLVSTWSNETSGINAFEAGERGVPAILCEDELPHASTVFLPPGSYLTCKPTNRGVGLALERLGDEFKIEHRQKLAHHLSTEYSFENYIIRADELVNSVYSESFEPAPCEPAYKRDGPPMAKVQDLVDHFVINLDIKRKVHLEQRADRVREINLKLGFNDLSIVMVKTGSKTNKEEFGRDEMVDVLLMRFNRERIDFKAPKFRGPVREWSKWQCLWNAGSYPLDKDLVTVLQQVRSMV